MLLVGQLPFFGQIPRSAEGHAARHYRHFHQRISPAQHPRNRGVTGFVISYRTLLVFGHDLRLALQAADNAVHRVHEILFAHFPMSVACRNQCSLVAHVRYIRTREAGRLFGKEVYIQRIVGLDRTQVHIKYLLTLLQIRQFHMYLPVKTSCAQQCRIQHVRAVRGGENYHAGVRAEAVHLRQQLVQCRFALVIAARHHVLAASTADSIYLVNKDNRRRFLFRLAEQIAYAACTYAHEHLHKVRTGHREERHVRFAGYRLGQQGLTCSRRAYEQRTLGNLSAQFRIFLRVFQKRHNLFHFLFRACQTGYVFECHLVFLVLVKQLHARLANTKDAAGSITDAAAHPYKEQDYQGERQYVRQNQIPIIP